MTRTLIEQVFGILKRRFHILHSEIRMKPERVCTIVTVRCILHNIAIAQNEALPECKDYEPWYEDDNENFAGVETGQVVRNHIANTYFK